MNHLLISSATFGTTSLILAIVVFIFTQHRAYRLWAAFNFSIAWWGYSLVMVCLANTNRAAADFWWKTATLGGLLLPVIFVHFATELTEIKKKRELLFLYAQVIAVELLYVFGFIKHRLDYLFNSFFYPIAIDKTYLIVTLSWVTSVVYGHYILYRGFSQVSEDKKSQIKYLFASAIIGFFSGGLAHFLVVYSVPIHPAWNILITVYALFITYGIFRYRLFDLHFVIRKGLIYTLLISIVTGLYFSALFAFEKIFQRSIGYNSSYSVGFIILVILTAEPLRIKIQSIIDKLFFHGSLQVVAQERDLLFKEVSKHDRLKAVSTLAAGMAHEIKNPLTAIKTFTDYLPEKGREPEFLERFQKVVGVEIDKIDGIVRQLLDFSKPSPLCLEKVSIQKIIRDTLDFLSGDLLKNKIRAESRFHEADTLILGDKKQLQQALLNLFLNAIQAMPGGGTLTVSTSLSPTTYLLITIQDTGPGIPKEHLDKIFEPFFTTKVSGTGLGLSIVKGIVEEHGGKIEAKSTAGAGTVFKMNFPNPLP